MSEQFTNAASSVLNGSITSGATSLVVTSAASFPLIGTFRILIDSEYMIVTAVSGTTFTVTRGAEGSIPASHNSGAPVTQLLTAGALYQLKADAIAGSGGGGGGGGYLPPTAPPEGTANILVVDSSGNVTWQPVGGYGIDSFSISGTGVASLVEVGSSQSVINWSAVFDFTPTSITVTCTGQSPQTPSPSGTTASGTFTGPFTSTVNGTTVIVSITAVDPNGASHSANASMTYATKIVWGSVTSPIAGQGLWGQLNALNNILSTSLNTTMGFASNPGQQQAFATLASLGTPILHDSGGDSYPPTLIGSVLIMENGTNQTFNFYTVGAPGITFTWSMS